ncbi:hypothetical protein MRX96_028279 [Rhipicephalus microplus]
MNDASQQREASGQHESSGRSPTKPEVTDKKTTEEQNMVEEQERGENRGRHLLENGAAPTKCLTINATLPNERASNGKQQRHERLSHKASSEKGNTSAQCLQRR